MLLLISSIPIIVASSPQPLMNYKHTLPILGILATIIFQAVHVHAAETVARNDRPNLIFILADDLSYGDLSCFGQQHFATPNIDRLASEGRIFANAYAGAPWCAPSRTALLTGRTARHFAPLQKNAQGLGTQFNPTVAEMLHTAGYATAILGKWHMQEGRETWFYNKPTRAEQRAMENPAQMPWHRGFDLCRIGYSFGLNPYFPHQIETGDATEIPLPENRNVDDDYLSKSNHYRSPDIYDPQGRFVDKTGKDSSHLRYAEDIYRAEAVKFITENQNRPFFLYYATPLVHGPLAVKELGQFKNMPAAWSTAHKVWAAEVVELDHSVGLILDELKKSGLATNTVVLFAADNGYSEWGYFGRKTWVDDPLFHNKGPWNRGKFVNSNGGVMVPFIAWGPGRVAPGKTGRAIGFYDFMATAGELSGAKLPGPTDGVSFVPLLAGRDQDQPLRTALAWSTEGNYGIKIPDDFDPNDKTAKYLPPAVLLDERWYALGIRKQPAPAPLTIRVFDIVTDAGCTNDLSSTRKDLCDRAVVEFQKLAAGVSE